MESTGTSRKYLGFSSNYLGFVEVRTRKFENPVKFGFVRRKKRQDIRRLRKLGLGTFASLQERVDKVTEQQWQILELIWRI